MTGALMVGFIAGVAGGCVALVALTEPPRPPWRVTFPAPGAVALGAHPLLSRWPELAEVLACLLVVAAALWWFLL